MRADTRKFIKKYRPELLEQKADKPKKNHRRSWQVKAIPLPIMYDMIKMRKQGISYWNITVWLFKIHNIDLGLPTVTRKLKAAISLLGMEDKR